MRAWLGKVVGKEAEDLSRHDKWLCMMYPRLVLLRELLREDGSLWMSIDDNEVHHARMLLDEVFGAANFVATVIWQKVYSPKNSAKYLSEDHDYIICFARSKTAWVPNLLARTSSQDAAYTNPDADSRGPWKSSDLSARNFYSEGTYSVATPSGRTIPHPPRGRYYSVSKQRLEELDLDNRIWWGRDGNSTPQLKRFLTEVKRGRVPQTFWSYGEVGHTQFAKKELVQICQFESSESVFVTPKPSTLVERVIHIASDPGDLVLDSFAGSGTTGHAVLKMNASEPSEPPRRFILVEMEPEIANNITAVRLQRAIDGYSWTAQGGKAKNEAALGGGFRYNTIGPTLYDEQGQIRSDVSFSDLAQYVFFAETGQPLHPNGPQPSPLLGMTGGRAVYLLYNGILADKSPSGGNALTRQVLASLPWPTDFDGERIVYGTSCRIGSARLQQERIVFKQIPYELNL